MHWLKKLTPRRKEQLAQWYTALPACGTWPPPAFKCLFLFCCIKAENTRAGMQCMCVWERGVKSVNTSSEVFKSICLQRSHLFPCGYQMERKCSERGKEGCQGMLGTACTGKKLHRKFGLGLKRRKEVERSYHHLTPVSASFQAQKLCYWNGSSASKYQALFSC